MAQTNAQTVTQPDNSPPARAPDSQASILSQLGQQFRIETAQHNKAFDENQAAMKLSDQALAKAKQDVSDAQAQERADLEPLDEDYDTQMQNYTAAVQRQRGLSISIGKAFKWFLPVAAAFGALAGKETGGDISSALLVFSKGLAGYANGRVSQYNQAQKKLDDAVKASQAVVSDTLQRMKDVMNADNMSIKDKMDALKTISSGNAALHKAALSEDPLKVVTAISALETANARMTDALSKFRTASNAKVTDADIKAAVRAHILMALGPAPIAAKEDPANKKKYPIIQYRDDRDYAYNKQTYNYMYGVYLNQFGPVAERIAKANPGMTAEQAVNLAFAQASAYGLGPKVAPPPAQKAVAQKTVTQQALAEYARKNKISVPQASAFLVSHGYVIQQ